MCFLWSLATMCHILVVSKRTLHASLHCVLCVLASLCLVEECPSWLNSLLFILLGELKWIKNRILLSFIAGPKIQAGGYFLTNQIRIVTYLFRSLNVFLLISFRDEFSRMLLYYVFSWLVEKYKSVTSMLMWFWSEFSRMF